MGRGSNQKALEAKQLLYGPRVGGSRPIMLRQETPASLFQMMCLRKQVPAFIQAEFPDCQVVGASQFPLPEGEQGYDGRVCLAGINVGHEKTLGIFASDKQSVYYIDETQPMAENPPEWLLPGNEAEQKLFRCLADNSLPGQEVEIAVYNRAQAESLIDHYGDKDIRLTDPDSVDHGNEARVLEYIYDYHPLLQEAQGDILRRIKTVQQLLQESGGKEILTSFLKNGQKLSFLISLDGFRSTQF